MHRVCLTSLVALVVGLLAIPASQAQDFPEVLFILDSSGSMQEATGGQQKIDAAKQVMSEVVPQLAPEVRVGLVAYGHRRPGDCTDVEVIVQPGSDDRDGLVARVKEFEPKGKTPISTAVLTAAGLLKTKDVETTIVLVSDGIETCGADPCLVVKQLKETGCKFVLHVVGFQVDDAAKEQLDCVAGAGGGKYFAATDAQSLLDALQQVSKEVAGKVEVAKSETIHAASGLGKLQITMPQGAEKSLQFIQVVRPRDEKVVKLIANPKDDSKHPLLSGKYIVRLGFATPNFGDPTITELGEVTIRKGETRLLQLGSISFNIPPELLEGDWKQNLHVASVILADAGSNEPVVTVLDNRNGYYNFMSKPIVAGVYNVLFEYPTKPVNLIAVAKNVTVRPGKDAVVTLNSGIRVKEAEGLIGWQLVPQQTKVAEESDEGTPATAQVPAFDAHAFGPVSGGSTSLFYPYLLPSGTYDVNVHVEGMDDPLPVAEGLQIGDGQVIEFDAGL